jgi:ATP-dependent Clp protease ATP-binding subunit ClpX
LGKRSIGFGQEAGGSNEKNLAELLPQATSDDVLEYGLIPELVGRLPVLCALTPLDEDGLVRVLTEPKNAMVRQYESLFEMENSQLSITEGGLRAIAKRALAKDTGARGLRSIMEEVMLDIMYELPDQGGGSYAITEDVVNGKDTLFKVTEAKSKSA